MVKIKVDWVSRTKKKGTEVTEGKDPDRLYKVRKPNTAYSISQSGKEIGSKKTDIPELDIKRLAKRSMLRHKIEREKRKEARNKAKLKS